MAGSAARGRAALLIALILTACVLGVTAMAAGADSQPYQIWIPWEAASADNCDENPAMPRTTMMGIPGMWFSQCVDFLDETLGARRELHMKNFEMFELSRKPEPDAERVIGLQAEITRLTLQIHKAAPEECRSFHPYGR